MTRFLFDQKTRVRDVAGKMVGVCRESFGFVKDSKLPAHVRELRNRQHITEIENGWVGEGYHRIGGTRVYHLNLIVRMMLAERSLHMRYRVVLNREGIKRIEHVQPR